MGIYGQSSPPHWSWAARSDGLFRAITVGETAFGNLKGHKNPEHNINQDDYDCKMENTKSITQ